MTTTISVHVNGSYRATITTTREDGTSLGETVVGHGETKVLPHYHGEAMTYVVHETPVASPGSGVEQNPAPVTQEAPGEDQTEAGKPEGE